jgi:hypothetical protein
MGRYLYYYSIYSTTPHGRHDLGNDSAAQFTDTLLQEFLSTVVFSLGLYADERVTLCSHTSFAEIRLSRHIDLYS